MYEAIRNAQEGNRELRKAERYEKKHEHGFEVVRYQGFNHLGYAEGINSTLTSIGFKHEDMKILGRLLIWY